MKIKNTIKSQYYGALEMLKQAIVNCPDSQWQNPAFKNQFWQTAYHVLFYTHLYLHPTEQDFVPWEKHNDAYTSLKAVKSNEPAGDAYSKKDILAYLGLCLELMPGQVDALDLGGETGFHWLPFDKLELQLYNIRHVQQHTGELYERLGAAGEVELFWVGMKPKS